MNGDLSRWNNGLLFAALAVVLGIVGVVSARSDSERWLARGLFLQGALLTYVVGAAFRDRSGDLKLGGLMIVGLMIVQCAWGPSWTDDATPVDEDIPS